MSILIALDQAPDHSGFAILHNGVLIWVGSIVTPTKIATTPHKSRYQAAKIKEFLLATRDKYYHSDMISVAFEGTYLSEYESKTKGGMRKAAVVTKGELDRLLGRLQEVCDEFAVPYQIVEVYEVGEYIKLPFASRFNRKRAAVRIATMFMYDKLPDLAKAFAKVYEYMDSWNPNKDGEPKTLDTLLARANKMLPDGMIVDIADAVIIGQIAYGKLRIEELAT